MLSPDIIHKEVVKSGEAKAAKSLWDKLILGFVGGAAISLGFLLHIRVTASIQDDWGSFATFIGASVFPLGLVIIVLAGGELITSNMAFLASSLYARRISFRKLCESWAVVTVANFIGAAFVAYAFGHVVGLTSSGDYLEQTVNLAQAKVDYTFLQAFISGIGCNWLVCVAVWMATGTKDAVGKVLLIWFPVMGFVAMGFQHSVANAFLIPAAIFEGHLTWTDYATNLLPVYLGNIVGGAVFVAGIYHLVYAKKTITGVALETVNTEDERLQEIKS